MNYAEIAVDAPVAPARTFSYSIPDSFPVEPGQLVWVPFGRRVIQGIVVSLADTPQVESTRDILQPVEPSPLVTSVGLELARWISRYYLCSLFDSLALLLPPSFKAHVRSRIEPANWTEETLANLKPQTVEALNSLASRGRLNESEFTKSLGANGAREVNRLVGQGIVQRQVDLPRPGSFRYDCWLIPVPAKVANGPEIKLRSSRQAQLIKEINSSRQPYRLSLANKEFGVGTANALVDKGLVGLEWVRTEPASPSSMAAQNARDAFTLTMPQTNALQPISQAIGDPNRQPRSFLLHGVTGSGKTEVYLRAMEQVVAQGQQAIFLVPEISLTPQTVERVSGRFPGRVAVLHSRQKPREKFDQWWNIRDGGCDVVVGPRSALFAPVANLGLIVIDEEHEWTYKQEEGQPLYHARTTALELARLTGAVVILGSATPDVETYYHAQRGRHCLLELPHRINPDGAETLDLARTEICDMREELRAGNRSIFSRALAQGLINCVQQDQQAILFLNRRGSSPIVQCRDCGYVATCPRCSVSLTYHSSDNSGDNSGEDSGDKPGNHSTDARLLCHRCNRRSRVPRSCRQCGGHRIRQIGIGTQRVVEEVSQLLPGVRVDRWDADASRAGLGPEDAMQRLASGETQVLVGTQMVAKGLHIPNVTLVGVILADIGLYLPDFRAGERAFSLLCQVAGRAGRGSEPGRVIIQTYNPEHYAVIAASQQNYSQLYQREIAARQQQGNPPFNRLVHLVFQDLDATACQRQATDTARSFRQKVNAQGLTDVEVIGPAPGIPQRVRGSYRWHVTLRGRNLHRFLDGQKFAPNHTVDVDPAHLL